MNRYLLLKGLNMLNLDKFKKNYVSDMTKDVKSMAEARSFNPIPDGLHEVIVSKIKADTDGIKLHEQDTLDGTLKFSLVVQTAKKQEQSIALFFPLAHTFTDAMAHPEFAVSSQFIRTANYLFAMGLDPTIVRESLVFSNGVSVDFFVGAQFLLLNYWAPNTLHLEYDQELKSHFLVNEHNERFTEGELAGPHQIDRNMQTGRFSHIIALAKMHKHRFSAYMSIEIRPHTTANNKTIHELFLKSVKKDTKPGGFVINKTIPSFPDIKKPAASIAIEEEGDIPF